MVMKFHIFIVVHVTCICCTGVIVVRAYCHHGERSLFILFCTRLLSEVLCPEILGYEFSPSYDDRLDVISSYSLV